MLQLPVYLDHNATTPCHPQVVERMLPFFSQWFGNAASHTHSFGWQAREAVDIAREQVAGLLGAHEQEIIFTSGATEAVNLAIKGVYERYAGKGNHIITCVTEHHAVLDTCAHLEKKGARVTYLPVDTNGLVDIQAMEQAIGTDTILICIMAANNEIGTLQPIRDIGTLARSKGVLFFTDASQAIGKTPLHVEEDHIDLLALSAHKFYGPKGVGALYVRRRGPRVSLTPQIDGGGHERGMRSGTLNVPGIVGLGEACRLVAANREADIARLQPLRDELEQALLAMEGCVLNGHPVQRLPHMTNISFAGVDGNALLTRLTRHIALSSGSACTSATPEPSYVLKAIGRSDELAHSALRMALGNSTTSGEIKYAIDQITEAVRALRSGSLAVNTGNDA
ncbi:MAG: IscS subfamily cysteine desulfurase [Chitinophagaceae bacterium]